MLCAFNRPASLGGGIFSRSVLFSFLFISVFGILTDCEKEADKIVSEANRGEVFRREFVGISAESPSSQETKVSVNSSTGVVSWVSGDEVAYCVTDGSTTRYDTATIDLAAGGFFAELESGYSRTGYVIYPASYAGGDATTPTVTFPSSYDMGGAYENPVPPVPMIAVNSGTSVCFYHVGGLIRLHLTEVDPSVTKIYVGQTLCAGATYSYSNAGTASQTVSSNSGTGGYVCFTNVNAAYGEVYLNFPAQKGYVVNRIEMYNSSDNLIATRTTVLNYTAARAHAKNLTSEKQYSINISTAPTLYINETAQFAATVLADGIAVSSPSISWTSSQTSVATVNSTGLVTATNLNAGTEATELGVTITASYTPPGKSAISASRTVKAKHKYTLTVWPQSATVQVGNTYTFAAYGTIDGIMTSTDCSTNGNSWHSIVTSWKPASTLYATSEGNGVFRGARTYTKGVKIYATNTTSYSVPATLRVN